MCIKGYRNHTRSILKTLCLLMASGLVTHGGAAAAGIYKWVDEQGQVHYGERPVSQDAEEVNIRTNETTKPRQIAPGNEENGEAEAEQADAKEKPAKPEKPRIPAAEKRRMCSEARSDIAAISSRGRMREKDAQGNYRYLSEDQRQQRLSAARKKQKKYCN